MEYLVKNIYKVVKKVFTWLTKPQVQTFSELIIALFYAETFTFRDISSKLLWDTNVKHKLKRLINFLDNFELNKEFWKNYVKMIFSLPNFKLWSRKYITLLLDATTLKDDFWILAISISFEWRAIPVYLKMWKWVNESYDYRWRVKEVLKYLKDILPWKYKYELIADRWFQWINMFELCRELEWDHVIRINWSFKIKKSWWEEYIQLTLFENWIYLDVTLWKNNPYEWTNIVINSITDETWKEKKRYLSTTLKNKEQAINDYSRRMWIEESFRDLKQILKWEKYTKQIPSKNRLEKMLIFSCLSYSVQLSLWSEIQVPPSEYNKTSIIKRFQHILISATKKVAKLFVKLVSSIYSKLYRYTNNLFKIYG